MVPPSYNHNKPPSATSTISTQSPKKSSDYGALSAATISRLPRPKLISSKNITNIGHTGVVTAIIQDSTASSSEDQRGYNNDANTSPECPRSGSDIRSQQQAQQPPFKVLPIDSSSSSNIGNGGGEPMASTSPATESSTSSDSNSELSVTDGVGGAVGGDGGGSDGTGTKREFTPTILKETITTGGYRYENAL